MSARDDAVRAVLADVLVVSDVDSGKLSDAHERTACGSRRDADRPGKRRRALRRLETRASCRSSTKSSVPCVASCCWLCGCMQYPFNCQHGHSCRGVFVGTAATSGALFDPSAPGRGDCQPPAGCTEERYVRGAVLLHLERRSEACGVVGSVPFDPGTEGDRGDGCPADSEGSIDRCHRSRRAIWLAPATAARGSVEEGEMVSQKCETRWRREKALKTRVADSVAAIDGGGRGVVPVESLRSHRPGVAPKAGKGIQVNVLGDCVAGEHFGTWNGQAHWLVVPTVTVPIMEAVRM